MARAAAHHEGGLPGGLGVKRRAPGLYRRLVDSDGADAMDWLNVAAMAVNEENACGGRIVTAPTNGAAGIVPAVLHYYERFVPGAGAAGVETFFLAAAVLAMLQRRRMPLFMRPQFGAALKGRCARWNQRYAWLAAALGRTDHVAAAADAGAGRAAARQLSPDGAGYRSRHLGAGRNRASHAVIRRRTGTGIDACG